MGSFHRGYLQSTRGRWLMTLVTMCSSTGFLLVGYDNGVMGGLVNNSPFLDTFTLDVERNATTIGCVVAIYDIGCFVGALFSALYAERAGRRSTILMGTVLMIIGAVMQGAAGSIPLLIAGRIISGLGMGGINSTVPVLQSEMSTPKSRGRLACVQLSTLNFGIMSAYWVDYAFSKIHPARTWLWRIPIIMQIIFIIALVVLTLSIPESPRWLIVHGHNEDAVCIIARLADLPNDDVLVIDQYDTISRSVRHERELGIGKWTEIVKSDHGRTRRRFLVACGIQAAQQLGGINALIYYSGTIFQQSIRLSNESSNLLSGCLNTWFLVASFIPHFLIDRLGRRRLLLSTISGMALCFAIMAILIKRIEEAQGLSTLKTGYAAAATIFIYLGLFTIGFQAVVWVIPSEVLPMRLRSKGSAVSTATNWIINYVVVQITPVAINTIGWKFYIIFCVLNASFLAPIYFFLPETAQKTLEQIDLLFSKSYHDAETSSSGDDTLGTSSMPDKQQSFIIEQDTDTPPLLRID